MRTVHCKLATVKPARIHGHAMPEGPEIRRAADQIERALLGQELTAVWFKFPALKRFESALAKSQVRAIETRGKALLTHFANDLTIYSHNQLYGIWRVCGEPENAVDVSTESSFSKRDLRLALSTAGATARLYSASDISVHPTNELAQHPFLSRVGPDVLDPGLSAEQLFERMRSRRFARKALSTLLLDQKFLAGMGNYLRSEVLFAARIGPDLRPIDLSDADARALSVALLAVPRLSYQSDGVTNLRALAADAKAALDSALPGSARRIAKIARGNDDYEAHRFAVFDRDGLPCYDCNTRIERIERAGRRLYFCPSCQSSKRQH